MKPTFAFDVCHELYRAAREVLDGDLGASDLTSHTKYLWRPDLRPRLVEYVADFALAGQRALVAPDLASRMVLFRVFYLGNAELHARARASGHQRIDVGAVERRRPHARRPRNSASQNISAARLF